MTSLGGLENYKQLATDKNWEGLLKVIDKQVQEENRELAMHLTYLFNTVAYEDYRSIEEPKKRAYKLIFGTIGPKTDIAKILRILSERGLNKELAHFELREEIFRIVTELVEKGLKEKNKEPLEEALKIATQAAAELSGKALSPIIDCVVKTVLAFIQLGDEDVLNKIDNYYQFSEVIKNIAQKNPKKAEDLLNRYGMNKPCKESLRLYIQLKFAWHCTVEGNIKDGVPYYNAILNSDLPSSMDSELINISDELAIKFNMEWAIKFQNKIQSPILRNFKFSTPPAPPAPFPKLDLPSKPAETVPAKTESLPLNVTANTVAPNFSFLKNLFR